VESDYRAERVVSHVCLANLCRPSRPGDFHEPVELLRHLVVQVNMSVMSVRDCQFGLGAGLVLDLGSTVRGAGAVCGP